MVQYTVCIGIEVSDPAKVIARANEFLESEGCAPDITDVGEALIVLLDSNSPPLDCGFEIVDTSVGVA